MKTPLIVFLSSLLLPVAIIAQSRPGTGNSGGNKTPTPNTPSLNTRPTIPAPDIDRPVFVSGKVVLPDGSPVTESVGVESICGNRKRVETYTDSRGNFSFELKKKSSTMAVQSADISSYGDDTFNRSNDPFQYQNCELQAVLAGFSSETVQLASHFSSSMESLDVGRITVRPIGQGGGSVLSATSLAAPGSAKKAWSKALEQEKKNKLDDAKRSLQKAVEIYPQYAAAWTELGRLQYMNHDSAAAQHSFEQALAADSKYAKPYLGLAELAMDSAQWPTVVELTTKLLALNSSYPAAWLFQGIGKYNLRDIDAAETSVRNGLKVDQDHRVPRLEHLLGLIMATKRDYAQAAEHMRAFLKFSTQPSEIAEGQKLLAEIERRSAQANLAPAAKQ
jgi:tetratricopeptide (TPR) repeat protein